MLVSEQETVHHPASQNSCTSLFWHRISLLWHCIPRMAVSDMCGSAIVLNPPVPGSSRAIQANSGDAPSVMQQLHRAVADECAGGFILGDFRSRRAFSSLHRSDRSCGNC